MILHWLIAILCAVIFGFGGFLGARMAEEACKSIVPFEDGPRTGKPPVGVLIGCGALLGMALGARGVPLLGLIVLCILVWALVACWCCDVLCGIIPDYFTLAPLGLILIASAIGHQWIPPLFSATVVFLPFAFTALISKGRGMGWGDVKLAALGGAALGMPLSFFALAGACMAAVVVSSIRKRTTEPMAFAPYLVGAIAIGINVPMP